MIVIEGVYFQYYTDPYGRRNIVIGMDAVPYLFQNILSGIMFQNILSGILSENNRLDSD